MKYTYTLLIAAFVFVSCNSGQQKVQTTDTEFDKQKEELTIRQLVSDVYKEVNTRWDKSNEGTEFDETMEEKYTTDEWQELYLDLRAIEGENIL